MKIPTPIFYGLKSLRISVKPLLHTVEVACYVFCNKPFGDHQGSGMSLPTTFLTYDTMLTFSGAMTATFVVVNGINKAFGWNRPWFGLVVAQIIVVGGTFLSTEGSPTLLLIAAVNGFLVFLSAAGLNEAAVSAKGFEPQSATPKNQRPFLKSWFWE
jgi:hypothetical protein